MKREKNNKPKNKKIRILSIDGGGLKGVFSAYAIYKLWEEYKINIFDHFDLFIGTSTGSVLTTLLLMKMSAKEIFDSYLNEGNLLFLNRFKLTQQLRKPFMARFDDFFLNKELKERLGNLTFAELEKKSGKQFIFTATNFSESKPVIFASSKFKTVNNRYKNLYVWEALRASSAAPFFFSPHREGKSKVDLLDGGLWANNPSVLGIMLANIDLKYNFNEIHVLSLGQTSTTNLEFKNYTLYDVIKSPLKIPENGLVSLVTSIIFVNQNFQNFLLTSLLKTNTLRYEPEMNFSEVNLSFFNNEFIQYCEKYWLENKETLLHFIKTGKNIAFKKNESKKYL